MCRAIRVVSLFLSTIFFLSLSSFQSSAAQGPTNLWERFDWRYPEIAQLFAGDPQNNDAFGYSVAISGDTLVVGAPWESGGPGDPAYAAGAVYIFERNLGGTEYWGQAAKITSNDIQTGDFFGHSVAIDGDTIVVGARDEDGGPGDPLIAAGAAYVFERNLGGSEQWGQSAKLASNDLDIGDQFGGDVAISGNFIIIGAYQADGSFGTDAGAAYVFDRNFGGPDNWGQVKKLTADDQQPEDEFGRAVDVHGLTIVIGANLEDGGSGDPIMNAGAAYVYERNLGGIGAWTQAAKLVASDPEAIDLFGFSVSIENETIAIGAPFKEYPTEASLLRSGAVYVFERNYGGLGSWGETTKLVAPDGNIDNEFGWSATVIDSTILIGARWDDGNPANPIYNGGAAYVYTRSGVYPENWTYIAKLYASDAQDNDEFGWATALDGNTLVLGAPYEDGGSGDPSNGSGSVYVFFEFTHLNFLPLIHKQ